jgi:hypothetical protein
MNITKKSKSKTHRPKTTDWSSSSNSSSSSRSSPLQPTTRLSNLRARTRTRTSSRPRSSSNLRTTASHSRTSSPFQYELKMPAELPVNLNYSEKIAKKMKKTFQLHDDVVPFKGSFHVNNLFYLYLFKKYKMDCILQNWQYGVEMRLNLKDTDPIINTYFDEIIETSSQKIINCILDGSKIIIIPFIFDIIIDEELRGGHANLLIYRQNTGKLEHFEPHGAIYEGIGGEFITEQINAFLKRFVKHLNYLIKKENKLEGLLGKREKIQKIKLLKSFDVCPDMQGLQLLEDASEMPRFITEPIGYCAAWSMFFTELCLKNPERSSRDIYEAIMEKTELYDDKNSYLRNIIRGYTAFINNKIAKHFSHVFAEQEFPQSIDILMEQIDPNNPDINDLIKVSMYSDKLLEIMEVETGVKNERMDDYPDVRSRYTEFTQGIRRSTSSPSYQSEGHLAKEKSHSNSRSMKSKVTEEDKGLGVRRPKGKKKTRRTKKHN